MKDLSGTNSQLLHNRNKGGIVCKRADRVSNGKMDLTVKECQTETLSNDKASSMVPIHTTGSRPPFFFLHGSPSAVHRQLGPEQPLYYFSGLWNNGKLPPAICIEDVATAHIEEIKSVQPEGPYFLGGYSVGGLLAFEMAQQLCRSGDEIAFLFLLEPSTPIKFSSKEGDEIAFLHSEKNESYLMKENHYMAKVIIAKLIELAFKGYDAILNSSLPLPSFLKADYRTVLNKLNQNSFFSRTSTGRFISLHLKRLFIDSGIQVPDIQRRRDVSSLYKRALKNYLSYTYPGQITIYKVKQGSSTDSSAWKQFAKQGSSVDISAWKQLAEGGTEIKEIDLVTHLDPIEDKNTSEWTGWLEHDLKNARINWSNREK
ncbi:MAG: hypothetical protein HN737_09940 [Desulfobacterales bacterium]|nr:hypothetical protein [Desulfobacterales bacterium]